MTRLAQVLLMVAAAVLWGASRMAWVEVSSFDGLGQPKTATLIGGSWSTALVPLALVLLAAAAAALAVRGWQMRLLAVLVAVVSAGTAYLAISLWVVKDVAVRAAGLAQVPVANLTGTQRHFGGAVLTLVAALAALVGAVLLMRSAAKTRPGTTKYEAPAVRRAAAQGEKSDGDMSERMIWDALDDGADPTDDSGATDDTPDNKGR